MASFDWQTFLDRHGIPYRSEKKDLYLHCPFCGSADHGQKMGVSVVGKGWGCWRQQTHRGHAPERLIQALLGCSFTEAQRIAGTGAQASVGGLGGFIAAVEGALGVAPPAARAGRLNKPSDFRPLASATMATGHFWTYLRDRGFTNAEIERMSTDYQLHYAISGDWSYRIIIPVHDGGGKWLTWTGRSIVADAKLRYKTLTADPDKAGKGPQAKCPINHCLLGLPSLYAGGRVLVLAEGPFDAMRLSLFVADYDMRATCLFGKAVYDEQMDLLYELRSRYDRMVLLLDPDAALDALSLQTRLAPLGVTSHLLDGDDDPGEMRPSAIRVLLRSLQKQQG